MEYGIQRPFSLGLGGLALIFACLSFGLSTQVAAGHFTPYMWILALVGILTGITTILTGNDFRRQSPIMGMVVCLIGGACSGVWLWLMFTAKTDADALMGIVLSVVLFAIVGLSLLVSVGVANLRLFKQP